jgi:hypothetical protein
MCLICLCLQVIGLMRRFIVLFLVDGSLDVVEDSFFDGVEDFHFDIGVKVFLLQKYLGHHGFNVFYMIQSIM